mgnify:CR=1 FL=1|jgi:hypothetical protein
MHFSMSNRWSEAECVPATHGVYVVGSGMGWRTGSAMGVGSLGIPESTQYGRNPLKKHP